MSIHTEVNLNFLKVVFEMKDSKFNVVFYSDGSQRAFSAAVYAATLLKNMPNMHLTVVQVQDKNSPDSMGTQYNWVFTWPGDKTSNWMKQVLNQSTDSATKEKYEEILTKTNEIFSNKGMQVTNEVIYSHSSIGETTDALIEYADENHAKLIIMGTRGPKDFDGLIHGSLAHSLLHKSTIPVLLIKKLPQEFIDNFCADIDNSNQLKVLLYSDGSLHSFSAAVYAAKLRQRIPFMHLTVLQVQADPSIPDSNKTPTWPTNSKSDWMDYINVSDASKKKQYAQVQAKINEIFSEKGHVVNQEIVFAKTSISETAKAIHEYAKENQFELIITGTRGRNDLQGLLQGSLAHDLLHMSTIPVILIKKLPQEFIDSFCSDDHC